MLFQDGDIVLMEYAYGTQWFRIDSVREWQGGQWAHFTAIKRNGERDRRWDAGFSNALTNCKLVKRGVAV